MFKGQYNHTIDVKGRLIVPAKYREGLGEEFVVTKGLDGCLVAYPQEEWKVFEEKFQSTSQLSTNVRKLQRFFFSGAADCEVDKQGRILLPAILREFAGLEKDVVFAGARDKVEIWSSERWMDANEFDDMEDVADELAEMGIVL